MNIKPIYIIIFTIYSGYAFAYDPYDCLDDIAKVAPEIPVGLATRLCSGAWTQEPVKCYIGTSIVDKGMVRGIAIELCAGSVSAENTLKCYAKSGDRKLSRGLATQLCGVKVPKSF
ncbi:MAG: hypothetical protein QM500_09435 [Methylococcales bacterium]